MYFLLKVECDIRTKKVYTFVNFSNEQTNYTIDIFFRNIRYYEQISKSLNPFFQDTD